MKMIRLLLALFSLSFASCQQESKLYLRTVAWSLGGLEISWLYVDEGKKLIVKNPQFGVNPLNEEKERAENPSSIGNYEVDGNMMRVKWADGKVDQRGVEFKDGEISAWDAGLCVKAKPFPNSRIDDMNYEGNIGFGNVSNNTTIRFGKDGSFSMRSMGAVLGTTELQGAISETPERTGTYSIEGNTLTFRFDDGEEWITPAQPNDMGNQEMIIGTRLFKKIQ
jgi:hypothetical protein